MRHIDAARRLLDHCQIKKAPVSVQDIATQLGINVRLEKFDREDNLSGVLVNDGTTVAMVINKSDPPTRQRFTMAHEIGHFYLKHKGELFVDNTVRLKRDGASGLAVDPFEIEANGFAAELLMPSDLLIKEVERIFKKSGYKSENLIEELAKHFEVSTQAMKYRLENLGLLSPA